MCTLVNSEDPDEMRHFIMVYSLFRQKEYNIFENDNRIHLDMYNGLSQVYCIKPQGRIHLVYKRLRSFFLKKLILKKWADNNKKCHSHVTNAPKGISLA